MSHFYHHAEDRHSTLRQSTAFRTSLNRAYRGAGNVTVTGNKKREEIPRTAREGVGNGGRLSIVTRDGGIMQRENGVDTANVTNNFTDRHERYVSLDVNEV